MNLLHYIDIIYESNTNQYETNTNQLNPTGNQFKPMESFRKPVQTNGILCQTNTNCQNWSKTVKKWPKTIYKPRVNILPIYNISVNCKKPLKKLQKGPTPRRVIENLNLYRLFLYKKCQKSSKGSKKMTKRSYSGTVIENL